MPNNDYANAGDQSRAERILSAIINDTEYDEPVQSRLEYLLLQLLGTLDAKADLDENGLIPVSEIPPQAFEYMVDVVDDTARFALTTDDVQKGDIVRVISTGIMYIVVDDTHLSTEAGYKPFAAGIAAKAIGDEDGNNIKQTYQTKLTQTQLSAVNSGITSTDVTQIGDNKNNILLIEQMNGQKNILQYDKSQVANTTVGGVVIPTANEDGSISLSGTAGQKAEVILIKRVINDTVIKNGNYLYSNVITGISLLIQTSGSPYTVYSTASANGSIINNIPADTRVDLKLYINAGVNCNGVTIYPMIQTADVHNAGFTDYQPYALSNVELTAAEKQNSEDILSLQQTIGDINTVLEEVL